MEVVLHASKCNTKDQKTMVSVQIAKLQKLWSGLRRKWQNSPGSSREASLQKLKEMMINPRSPIDDEAETLELGEASGDEPMPDSFMGGELPDGDEEVETQLPSEDSQESDQVASISLECGDELADGGCSQLVAADGDSTSDIWAAVLPGVGEEDVDIGSPNDVEGEEEEKSSPDIWKRVLPGSPSSPTSNYNQRDDSGAGDEGKVLEARACLVKEPDMPPPDLEDVSPVSVAERSRSRSPKRKGKKGRAKRQRDAKKAKDAEDTNNSETAVVVAENVEVTKRKRSAPSKPSTADSQAPELWEAVKSSFEPQYQDVLSTLPKPCLPSQSKHGKHSYTVPLSSQTGLTKTCPTQE